MKIIACIKCFALVTASFLASAAFGSSGTGTVTAVGGKVDGSTSVYFGVSSPQANNLRPSCSQDSGFHFGIDSSTPEGKALYSAVLMAASSKATIYITGTGDCLPGYTVESVSYWSVVPK